MRSYDSDSTLIDMSALKAGGGCQLALNFLSQESKSSSLSGRYFLVPDSGPLTTAVDQFPHLDFISSPTSSASRRLLFERSDLPRIYRDLSVSQVYTFFGPGLPHPPEIKSIVSVAYPIICYPESSYWRHVPRRTVYRQRALNSARIHRLKSANIVVAETEVMRRRLAKALRRSSGDIIVSPPAPSDFVSVPVSRTSTTFGRPNVLMLSGTAPHKNVWRLPELTHELLKIGDGVQWLLSVTRDAFYSHLPPHARAAMKDIDRYFTFLGGIPPREIQVAYDRAAALLSLSDLESFSNNYLEAWKSDTPLIASDRDFAREVCGGAAVYVEPHSPRAAAEVIMHMLGDTDGRERRVAAGRALVAELPTSSGKRERILELLHP